MLKRIASLILFAMLAGGPRVRGDELVRWHHEWQGTALVESPMGTFSAALAYEDFDPQHTPEIGYKVLLRLYLTPFQRFASPLAPSDLPAALQVGTTKDGHSILSGLDGRLMRCLVVKSGGYRTNCSLVSIRP